MKRDQILHGKVWLLTHEDTKERVLNDEQMNRNSRSSKDKDEE